MVQLHQDHQRFVSLNCEIIVVSPDPAAAFRALWQAQQFRFLGLPDTQHQVLDLYGQRVNWLKLGRMPAQALIDREGRLRFLHYGGSMNDIPTNAQLLAQVAAL